VFGGENVDRLGRFLEKERQRLRESERKNIPFSARGDDKLDLY
jgi:F-box and leucine-rich repeat protein GRR1